MASPGFTEAAPTHHFDIIARYPHDQDAFTQGLVMYRGELYESTGLRGRSSVRRLDLESGHVLVSRKLNRTLFGEGLAVVDAQLVQLTWQSGSALVYTPHDLHQTGSFRFSGEGWGSTSIGTQLVISDGSSWLKFLEAGDYRHAASLRVTHNGRPLQGLNELEVVDGLIYANVYPSDCIAQIDPHSGHVVGWIDLGGLMPLSERPHSSAVANGIAYNAGTGDLFVTGKLWPYIYQLKLKIKLD
ncbi:Glutamine cyclotransferase [hydrothermal vent metagenome]|uniref:Glutamine cyclotransferase n=1 Tax=hydrothermal vent metagenome TaxID=652676 RepID=A0A3B0YGT1_9ZZZZ